MTEPALSHADVDALYRARLFGPFRFEMADGASLDAVGRKTRAMLAYLLLAGRDPVSRETLAGLLWGDRREEQARGSLRYALHEVRRLTLGDAPLLTVRRAHIRVDVGRIETDLGRLRALNNGSDAETLGEVLGEQPAELLRDLGNVDPAFDDWLAGERIRRQEERRATAIAVARRALAAGSVESAYSVAARLLAAEPFDEMATKLAMEARSRLGDRDGVRRAFARYADALRRDVDAAPPPEMIALRDQFTLSAAPSRHEIGSTTVLGPPPAKDAPRPARRAVIAAGTAAVVTASLGAFIWRRRTRSPAEPSARSAELLRQALLASRQDTRDGQKQAVGLLRYAVAQQPDFADGWGALAMAYAFTAHWRASDEAADLRGRARAAADRAQALAPRNALAEVAISIALPTRNNWLNTERALRRALDEHPEHGELTYALAQLLVQVGRAAEAAPLFERVRRHGPPNPGIYFREIYALWSANRLEETDRLIEEANQLFPSQFAVWFARLYIFMFTGRIAEAIAILNDSTARPTGIGIGEFNSVLLVVRALQSHAKTDVDQAMVDELARAGQGAGFAENTIQFASALDRLDDAFAVAEANYFNRGFVVPDVRFSKEQGTYTPLGERQTNFLFFPVTAPMRADRRFEPLVEGLGLVRYWRQSGATPDYLHLARTGRG
jgi:DNA-binding SARP family transcriptional activator